MKECISVKKGKYLATQMHKFYILWFIKQENHKTIRSQVEKRLKERWRFWAENGKKLKIGCPQDIVKINLDTRHSTAHTASQKDEIGDLESAQNRAGN